MKTTILGILFFCSISCFAQVPKSIQNEDWQKIYRASATKINDLVNTTLDVRFDYSKSWMCGKAWITLHPHFYATDSLTLDANSMVINEVSLVQKKNNLPLKYRYDGRNLRITLNKTYDQKENYTVFIDYIAKPDDINEKVFGGKGLHFINPLGKEKDKPTEIWTQGETESNSGWFPTIDKPNQKMTEEIRMTVEDKYQTLSNGLLISSKKNRDGTRTDTWRMNLPHAPYLVVMAVGDYAIIKDSYKKKPVNYYVEKQYAPVARKIFGYTPEMIAYFSGILGMDFPWQKYDQMVVRDFAGAMENTTATLHQESAQQDARQLLDGNAWEFVIAHELFHQWFGDLVTCESWSNSTLNESLADYAETLWKTYKYGRDAGDEHNYTAMEGYLQQGKEDKDLVRFYYESRDEMFDYRINYQKGGRILGMLRNYTGDSAFFKSLNLYLNTKKFQTAEAHDLRMAFEQVTGKDLNWFWNQWYYGSGHPLLDISYAYNAETKKASVFLKQTQKNKVFKFQIAVDVYQGGEKKRYIRWIDQETDTLSFPADSKPDLINVDGDKVLLCKKNDHKTIDNFTFQYFNAGLYADRREAIDFAAQKQDKKSLDLLKAALKDKYDGLRLYTVQKLNLKEDSIKKSVEPLLSDLAEHDPKPLVRAGAIQALGKYKKGDYKSLFLTWLNDSSYTIAGNSLMALSEIDSTEALNWAKAIYNQTIKGALASAVEKVYYKYSKQSDFDSVVARFENVRPINRKFAATQSFATYIKRTTNTENFKKGIDLIIGARDSISKTWGPQIQDFFNEAILKDIASEKEKAKQTEMSAYVISKVPTLAEKGKLTAEDAEKENQKYEGKYNFFGGSIDVKPNPDKTIKLTFSAGAEMQLTSVAANKFSIRDREGYSVEFTVDENNVPIQLVFKSADGEIKATKAK